MEKSKFSTTHKDDEMLELVRKTDHKTLAIWAADCAEHVLARFEKQYPEDNRPLKAIEAGRAWIHGDLKMTDARKAAFAAHAAARAANQDAEAQSAARSAGHAAATAHVANHAIYAALYACAAIPNNVATKERDWQYQHLLNLRDSH
ncbi:MAG TPA: hypothetical protein VNW29_03330 [Candidatus Sulfotelmatobacter sp.]|jgi:hypothetical protein|nr:hypothetical protein [Candidatus Sulfotelmatobacter sp.]